MSKTSQYTTDSKVIWYMSENDINEKLSSIIGEKFVEYRKKWDRVNSLNYRQNFHCT